MKQDSSVFNQIVESKVKNKSSLLARAVAIDVLLDIFNEKTPLDISFDSRSEKLSTQDKAFCFALINFVLRKTIALDAVIENYMKKPYLPESIERQILRIGLAQLFFMDSVEEFACIHTSVELAKVLTPRASKVVNAVLRESQRSGFDFLEENYDLLYELPEWLSKKLNQDYPQKAASLKSGMLKQGSIDVRLRDKQAYKFLQENATPIKYLPGLWKLKDGVKAANIPGIKDFSVYVQDTASQLVGFILSRQIESDGNVEKPIKILDLCAAPGGKTIHLLDLLPYAHVTACDNNPKRLKLLEQNLQQAFPKEQDRYCVCLNDATNPTLEPESFDYILLDAPCSGLGISRSTQMYCAYKNRKKELETIISLQKQIIPKAFSLLKPGGTMMYSTCSIIKGEGEDQINDFIVAHPNAKVVNVKNLFDHVGIISLKGSFRTFPTDEMDGFFMTLLQK